MFKPLSHTMAFPVHEADPVQFCGIEEVHHLSLLNRIRVLFGSPIRYSAAFTIYREPVTGAIDGTLERSTLLIEG